MRSRSVTSLSAVVRKRRSEATGWRRASICMHSSSTSISSWLIFRSTAIICSASALSRSMRARMLPLMMSSDLGAHEQEVLAQAAQLPLVLAVGVLA